MIQNLTPEQIAYLKSLDSKKKRRKFMLDCLVESVIGESTKIDTRKISDFPSTQINEHVKIFHTNTTAPRTFELLQYPNQTEKKMEGCKRLGKKFIKEKHVFQNNDLVYITDLNGVRKSGYVQKPENENEFEVILCDINWTPLLCENLAVSNFAPFAQKEKKHELLKFDALEDKKADELVDSLLEFHKMAVKCVLMKENPAPILSNYLLLFQKLYFYKTKDKIEFIEKMFPQLKNNESANPEKKQKSIIEEAVREAVYSEKKYTEEDMRRCFEESRLTLPSNKKKHLHVRFDSYINSLKND